MDRSTKERLTGAIVLVAVAWLVIPVFLDGPEAPEETVRQTVDLPGQDGLPTRTKTIVLNPRSGEPPANTGPVRESRSAVPAATKPPKTAPDEPAASPNESTPQAASEATRAVPEESGKEPEPEPESESESETGEAATAERTAPSVTPQTASADSLWAVQLGSFSSEDNAERLASELRKQGFAAFLSRVQTDGKRLHRVRVGPQGSREEAGDVARRLADAGHKGQVVSHP